MNQNENDPLTAEELYDQKQRELSPCVKRELRLSKIGIINLMEQYAAQQIKQVTEERDRAVTTLQEAYELLNHVRTFYQLSEPLEKEIDNFLNSLNAASSDTGKK